MATQSTFSMAPDGLEDYIYIHSAFLSTKDGELLQKLLNSVSNGDLPEVVVQIGRWPEEAAEGSSEEAVKEESLLQEKDEGKPPWCLMFFVCKSIHVRTVISGFCPDCH